MGLFRTNSHRETRYNLGCVPFISIFAVMWGYLVHVAFSQAEKATNESTPMKQVTYQNVYDPSIRFTREEMDVSAPMMRWGIIFFTAFVMLAGTYTGLMTIGKIYQTLGDYGLKWYFIWAIHLPIIFLGATKLTSYRCAVRNSNGKSDEWLYLITLVLTVIMTMVVVINDANNGSHSGSEPTWFMISSPVSGFVVYHLLTKPVLTSILVVIYKIFVKANTPEGIKYVAYLNEAKAKRDSEMLADAEKSFSFNKVLGMFSVLLMILMPFAFIYAALNPEFLMSSVSGSAEYILSHKLSLQISLINIAKLGFYLYSFVFGVALLFSSVNSITPIGTINRLVPSGKVITKLLGVVMIYASLIIIPNNFFGEEYISGAKLTVDNYQLQHEQQYEKKIYLNESFKTPLSELVPSVRDEFKNTLKKYDKDKVKREEFLSGRNSVYSDRSKENERIAILVLPLIIYLIYKLISISHAKTKLLLSVIYIAVISASFLMRSSNFDESLAASHIISGALSDTLIKTKNYDGEIPIKDVVNTYINAEQLNIPFGNFDRFTVQETLIKGNKRKKTILREEKF